MIRIDEECLSRHSYSLLGRDHGYNASVEDCYVVVPLYDAGYVIWENVGTV